MSVRAADDWMGQAWCARVPDLPWRDDAAGVPSHLVSQMAAICAACPVRDECADYVTATGICGGFWAGADRSPEAAIWRTVDWLPIHGRHGHVIAEQACLPKAIVRPRRVRGGAA